MIKAVLMDLDNTLLDFNESARESIRIAFNNHGLPFDRNSFNVFKTINDGLWLKIERGDLDRVGLHKIRFPLILKELGLEGDGLKIETEFRENLFDIAIPVENAQESLEYLSSKYTVYLASNAIYNQQVNRLTKSGLIGYVKDLFISEKIGFNKPTKQFFDQCFLNMNGVLPSQTVMIGDSITADIKGGYEYGLVTVWYNHDKNQTQSPYAHYKIDNLLDVKKFL